MTAIVQINFVYEGSHQELVEGSTAVAPKFQKVEGLLWKVWLGACRRIANLLRKSINQPFFTLDCVK